ncbi:MAG: undecaprenyl-diphosphatase [Alicyclobacillus sp.]|nr:undecaprenyl-diphosphatase [Alicyclobacillus sp.]
MNPFDNHVFHFINGFAGHTPILDTVMPWIAKYCLEAYMALFIITWFLLPKKDSDRRHALVVSVLAGCLALLINVVISHFWYRPRPFVALPHGQDTQLVPHAADASFPSDHAAGGWAFASALWGRGPKALSWIYTILGVLVMIARVYTGLHWPTDVIGGMVIGIVSGRVMWAASRFIYPITSLGLRWFHYGEFARRGRSRTVSR